jgi:hypothetical protein
MTIGLLQVAICMWVCLLRFACPPDAVNRVSASNGHWIGTAKDPNGIEIGPPWDGDGIASVAAPGPTLLAQIHHPVFNVRTPTGAIE